MPFFIRKSDGKPASLLEVFLYVQTLPLPFFTCLFVLLMFFSFPEDQHCTSLTLEGFLGMPLFNQFVVGYSFLVVKFNILRLLDKYILKETA